ncbi:hypothetical protein D3C76_984280 [compost metagenome]
MEAQLLQGGEQSGVFQVFGDHQGAGGQAAFDVSGFDQTAFHRFLGDETGAQHNAGVGGVGAAGDGGDNHGAVAHEGAFAVGGVDSDFFLSQLFLRQAVAALVQWSPYDGVVGFLHAGQLHTVLGTFGSGQAGHHSGQVQFNGVAEYRIGSAVGAEHALSLVIGLHQGDLLLFPAGQTQVVQGFGVNREKAYGCSVLRAHIGYGCPVGQTHAGDAGAVIFHEFAHDALLAEHLGGSQRQVSGGGALRQAAGELEADNIRRDKVERLTQHAGFRLDAAYAPANNAQAVDHGGVGVGAHQGIGIGYKLIIHFFHGGDGGQIFQVDLVHNARSRRHGAEVVKGGLRPAQEAVPFPVALKLHLGIVFLRFLRAEGIHHDGVVDNQIHGDQRVDFFGVAAGGLHG